MLYINKIEEVIKNTLQEHHLKLNYEINNNLPVPMSFNVSTNTIKFNYIQINGYLRLLKINESPENLIKVLLYHEIGYYLDFKKNKHDLRTLLYGDDEEVAELKATIEKNAWDYGRTLVPEHLLKAYDYIRQFNNQMIKNF